MNKIVVLMVSAALLSACSSRYATNGEHVYLQSQNGEQLVIPPPLTASNISHFYDLPPRTQNAVVNIAPPSAPEMQADQA
ncbi:hypothetical protein ACFORL_10720 [Legionella dresdenensis]|uniref:Outer membrane protein assembly factor BamC n=1 Tax=Legionella dresdenensis TaxID=450200 RepID=A0ABV8CH37_9GAMM